MSDPTLATNDNLTTTIDDNYNAAASALAPEDELGLLPPATRRSLSAQRVAVVMNPDGSITKPHVDIPVRPRAPIRPSEAELHHPTVAAPVSSAYYDVASPSTGSKEDSEVLRPPPPPQLANIPVDVTAIHESEVRKKPVDDLRPTDVEELTKKGHDLDSEGVLINGLSREDLWALIRRFDKASVFFDVVLACRQHKLIDDVFLVASTTCS